jgi:hypothetical protein
MSKVTWLLAVVVLFGCNSKADTQNNVAIAIPEPVKTVETKTEPPKTRNLHVKESHVISVLNAKIGERQQFDFAYADKMETGRYYLDGKSQVRVLFNGDQDDVQWVMVTMFLDQLLKENEPQNIKSFLNAANRMMIGVSPSIVDEADGWLDSHLVQSFLAKEPTTTTIGGFRLEVIQVGDPSIVAYKISSAD